MVSRPSRIEWTEGCSISVKTYTTHDTSDSRKIRSKGLTTSYSAVIEICAQYCWCWSICFLVLEIATSINVDDVLNPCSQESTQSIRRKRAKQLDYQSVLWTDRWQGHATYAIEGSRMQVIVTDMLRSSSLGFSIWTASRAYSISCKVQTRSSVVVSPRCSITREGNVASIASDQRPLTTPPHSNQDAA